MKKRFISILLSLALVLALLPATAFASSDNYYYLKINGESKFVYADTVGFSGTGWSFDITTKTLTLNGYDGSDITIDARGSYMASTVTIELAAGTVNKVHADESAVHFVWCSGKITGSGSLEISSYRGIGIRAEDYAVELDNTGDITIQSSQTTAVETGKFTKTGSGALITDNHIYAKDSIYIGGPGKVQINCPNFKYNALHTYGTLEIAEGGSVTVISGGYGVKAGRLLLSGGALTATAPSAGSAVYSSKLDFTAAYRKTVMSNGSGTTVEYVRLAPTLALTVGGNTYTGDQLSQKLSGTGWTWELGTLKLNNYHSSEIAVKDEELNLVVFGTNEVSSNASGIRATKDVNITLADNAALTVNSSGSESACIKSDQANITVKSGTVSKLNLKTAVGTGLECKYDVTLNGSAAVTIRAPRGVYIKQDGDFTLNDDVSLDIRSSGMAMLCYGNVLLNGNSGTVSLVSEASGTAVFLGVDGKNLLLNGTYESVYVKGLLHAVGNPSQNGAVSGGKLSGYYKVGDPAGPEVLYAKEAPYLMIGSQKYSNTNLKTNISDDGWSWNASRQVLTLNSVTGAPDIKAVCMLLNVELAAGQTQEAGFIIADYGLTVTGSGSLDADCLYCKSGDITLNQSGEIDIYSSELDGSVICSGNFVVSGTGDVRIRNTRSYGVHLTEGQLLLNGTGKVTIRAKSIADTVVSEKAKDPVAGTNLEYYTMKTENGDTVIYAPPEPAAFWIDGREYTETELEQDLTSTNAYAGSWTWNATKRQLNLKDYDDNYQGIWSYGDLNIRLEGENRVSSIMAGDYQNYSVENTGSLTIFGPGSLMVYDDASYGRAIFATGDVTINLTPGSEGGIGCITVMNAETAIEGYRSVTIRRGALQLGEQNNPVGYGIACGEDTGDITLSGMGDRYIYANKTAIYSWYGSVSIGGSGERYFVCGNQGNKYQLIMGRSVTVSGDGNTYIHDNGYANTVECESFAHTGDGLLSVYSNGNGISAFDGDAVFSGGPVTVYTPNASCLFLDDVYGERTAGDAEFSGWGDVYLESWAQPTVFCGVEGCGIRVEGTMQQLTFVSDDAAGYPVVTDLEGDTNVSGSKLSSYPCVQWKQNSGDVLCKMIYSRTHGAVEIYDDWSTYVRPTCTEEGRWDRVEACELCGTVLSRWEMTEPAYGHEFEDGKCKWCGEVEFFEDLPVGFSATCSFDERLAVNFYVPETYLAGYENVSLEVVFENWTGNVMTLRDPEYITGLSSSYNGAPARKFTFSGISAPEVGNLIHATIYAEKDGTFYKSRTVEYSISRYCYNMLKDGSGADAGLKKLCVNVLNYASAAQTYFNMNPDNLTNAQLTDAQRALAGGNVAVTARAAKTQISGAKKLESISAKVNMASAPELIFDLTLKSGVSASSLRVFYSYYSLTGKKTVSGYIPVTEARGSNVYRVKLDGFASADMRQPVTVKVLEGDTPVYDIITYSLECYCTSMLGTKITDANRAEMEKLQPLCQQMMNYSNAAKEYFVK